MKVERHTFGGSDWQIRSLLDRCQYDDSDGEAERRGIPAASWPYFGQVWAAGLVLGDAMGDFELDGRRILEIGCGLALGGLVAHRRGADVTASDRHPLAGAFLVENLRLNGLGPLRYRDLDWSASHPALGRFDVVIGSDVLYEPDHCAELVRFAERHLEPGGALVLVDPGRGRCAAFSTLMAEQGFAASTYKPDATRTRVMRFDR